MDRKTNPKSEVWLPMGAADEAEERRDEESVPRGEDPPFLDLWRPCSCRTWNREHRDRGTELGRSFEFSNGIITDICYFILEHAMLGDHVLTS